MWNITLLLYCLCLNTLLYAQTPTVGTLLLSEEVEEDYVLFAPVTSKSTYLIDRCGKIANQWTSGYIPGVACYLDKEGFLWRAGRYSGSFIGGGLGGIIEKFTWNNELIGAYILADNNYHQHHDFHLMDNGNILTINWSRVDSTSLIAMGMKSENITTEDVWLPLIQELKLIDNKDHEVVWQWQMVDHFIQDIDPELDNFGIIAENPHRFDINIITTNMQEDRMHINSIDYNEELDQIAFNSPFANEFYIIDHSTSPEEAGGSTGGTQDKGGDLLYRWGNPRNYGIDSDQQLFGQHDIRWIDNHDKSSNFTIFNNHVGINSNEFSEVLEIENTVELDGSYMMTTDQFPPLDVDWTLNAENGFMEFSSTLSGAQRLANGNTLVTVGESGHLLEYTIDKKLLWEYIIPLNGDIPIAQGNSTNKNSAFFATSYNKDFEGFSEVEINPSTYIELQSDKSYCELINSSLTLQSDAYIIENPVSDRLRITPSAESNYQFSLFETSGQLILQKQFAGTYELDVTHLSSGLYFLTISSDKRRITKRIVKL